MGVAFVFHVKQRTGLSPPAAIHVDLQIVAQLAAAAGVAQAAEGLGLDLANTLARHAKLLAHFFQRIAIAIHQPKAQLQDAHLTRGQALEDFVDHLAQQLLAGGIAWGVGVFVLDEVAQIGIFFLAHRHFQAQRALAAHA